MKPLRIAIVHEWLTDFGGSERVLIELHRLFPTATIYCLVVDKKRLPKELSDARIIPSFLQRWRGPKRNHQAYLWIYPVAVEQFDLSAFDVVISNSHCVAKGALTRHDQLHLCYCYTPMRYIWDHYNTYIRETELSTLKRRAFRLLATWLRVWDVNSANRVDYFAAISEFVGRRIEKTYRRKSRVIYPPADDKLFVPDPKGVRDYYLVVSRFAPYKRIDLAINSFTRMKKRLLVVGSGPQEWDLKRSAGENIEFLGTVKDQELVKLYQNCKALIFTPVEDFGLSPVEAQLCGRPVIAYRGGGALETVKEGEAGIFFDDQTEQSLISAVEKLEKMEFDPDGIRNSALRFGKERFHAEFEGFVSAALKEKGLGAEV